jgi:DNA-directed RNA polymerase subunit E'/Rpb7
MSSNRVKKQPNKQADKQADKQVDKQVDNIAISSNMTKDILKGVLKTSNENKQEIVPILQENKFTSSVLHSPYINTTLVCPVMLQPTQMDNKLYLHLKTNLVNKLVGKCYLNYGHIIKIYKIDEISDGIIEAEDSACSAKIIVKFSCKLCLPAKNKEIICKIDRMNKALISGINGPIKAIITPDKINKEKFFTDTDRNIRIKSNSEILLPNIYIKVLIFSSTFSNYDTDIISIAYLQDIATQDEINMYEKELEDN